MKYLVALAALLTAAPSTPQTLAPNSTLWSDATPPARYRGEAIVTVAFVRNAEAACLSIGASKPPPSYTILACHKGGLIIMPLPSADADAGDRYAHLMDHELGHSLGWPITHGD